MLTVVDVSLQSAAPCIRIFAAVLALARTFKGYASFARLLGDATPEAQELLKEYKVVEASTDLLSSDLALTQSVFS